MGPSVFALMHPDDRAVVELALQRMFEESSDEIVKLRFRAQHADGHWMVVEARGNALRVDGSRATQAGVRRPYLTESIAAEVQLAESRETTRAFSTPPSTRSLLLTENSRSLASESRDPEPPWRHAD